MSLNYLPRSAWTTRASRGPTQLRSAGLLGTVLHWPGMGSRRLFAQVDVAAALRGWQADHMDNPKKRWSDIAYQVAVDQAGRAWTLRGLQTRSAANGDEEANSAYGAILLVLGSGESPTGALIKTTSLVITDFRRLYPKATQVRPHSAVRLQYTGEGTDCPGSPVRGLIARGQFEPSAIPANPGENDMTPGQADVVVKAYALWSRVNELDVQIAVAKATGDTKTATALAPFRAALYEDWQTAAAALERLT